MRPFTRQLAPSTLLPLTLAEAESHCKLSPGEDSDYLEGLIRAVAGLFERESKQALMQATYVAVAPYWNGYLDLPANNLAINKIQFVTEKEADMFPAGSGFGELLPTSYEASVLVPGTVYFANHQNLPAPSYTAREPIRLYFTAGYESAADVPAEIKQWLKLVLLHFYENRQPSLLGITMQEVPMSAKYIMDLIREPTL